MKILHIISSMGIGGIESLVFSILRADVKNVYIFALSTSREDSLKNWPAIAAYSDNLIFADKKSGFDWEISTLIKKACIEHDIDVIHSHHIGPLIYSSMVSKTMKSLKHVHTQHDIWHLNNRKHWLIEYVILKMRKDIRLIAVSSEIYKAMKKLFPKSWVSLVYNGIDTNRFIPGDKKAARKALDLPLDAQIIATAGRLELVKGQAFLIEAMRDLPSYFLVIAGSGSQLQALEQKAKNMGVSNRICFLNQIDEVELVYQACDIFCLPSLEEGLPLAILEAQACNVPVVCSDVGSCADGIDKESGKLIPAGDVRAIVEACLAINPEHNPPRDFILAQFSLTALINKYQAIYENQIAN